MGIDGHENHLSSGLTRNNSPSNMMTLVNMALLEGKGKDKILLPLPKLCIVFISGPIFPKFGLTLVFDLF
uniref:Putative ovule protein n=1 Tax=Solanum chacoense TaxID=4108 RepID=A0A0V0GX74_SOLCH